MAWINVSTALPDYDLQVPVSGSGKSGYGARLKTDSRGEHWRVLLQGTSSFNDLTDTVEQWYELPPPV